VFENNESFLGARSVSVGPQGYSHPTPPPWVNSTPLPSPARAPVFWAERGHFAGPQSRAVTLLDSL
jgi:hypothetical protein